MNQAERMAAMPVEDVRQPDLELTTVEFDRQWQHSLLRPALLTLMLGCVVTAGTYVFVVLLDSFTESMANVIVVACSAAALTACAMGALTWQAGKEVTERLKFRIGEPLIWIVVLRIGLWLAMGSTPPLGLLVREPITTVFDASFIVGAILVLLVWGAAEGMNRMLMVLSLQPDEVDHIARAYGRLSEPVENTLRSDRRAQLDRFIAMWIGLGILVIVLAAGSQVRPTEGEGLLTIRSQLIHPRAIVSTIIYFFAGFLVIGQARLVALRARWALDGLAVDEGRFRNWMAYVVAFVAVVGLITSLVPIGDTILLLRALQAVWQVAMAFMFLLLRGFGWLVGLFMSGDSGPGEAPAPAAFEMPETFQPEEAPLPAGGQSDLVPHILFWSAVAIAALIGGYHLLAARGFDWTWLRARLAMLLGLFRRTVRAGAGFLVNVVNRVAGIDVQPRQSSTRQAAQGMSLDEQVQFTYLSVLDEAAERGAGRTPSETPRRYAPRLSQALAEDEARPVQDESNGGTAPEGREDVAQPSTRPPPDVGGLTDAFYRARYSSESVDARDVTLAEQVLRRIRALWRRPDSSGSP
ncbi:MAG: DUF4129 domain-containing protein [Caldilineaceae bacterium]|nr:DUF4129 domain-containing protein [Caldilineaceae bacterium]